MLRKWIGFASFFLIGTTPAIAQNASSVTADNSVGTRVNDTPNTPFTITEGTLRTHGDRATLFHSFETFSPAARSVVFDLKNTQNSIDTQHIDLIISRVTGNESSFINGQLSIVQDIGTPAPDLFILNSQGIEFGAKARFSLPGSFLASTASSVAFETGMFSTSDLSALPLLTMSAPIGLGLDNTSQDITVRGNGHQIAAANPTFAPYRPTGENVGLAVGAGKTLALMGQNIQIAGGVLNAPGGRAELGGVVEGNVSLAWDENRRLSADYGAIAQFGNIDLTGRSLVSTSAVISGAIQLQGSQIKLTEGSLLWAQNRGDREGAKVLVQASENFTITGTTPAVDAISGIVTETVASGTGGAIDIVSPQVSVRAGGTINSRSFGTGESGTVTATSDNFQVDGFALAAPRLFSSVGTTTFLTAEAGNVIGRFQDLSVSSGGFFGSTTLGSGRGGNVVIQADTVNVSGASPVGSNSLIVANSVNKGGSGNLSLRVRTLNIRESGFVTTAAISLGNAGNINIQASDNISLSGGIPGLLTSSIASTVVSPPDSFRQLLGLSETPEADAGSITLSTPLLRLNSGATVNVSNSATGNAGQIAINADILQIKDAAIDGFTASGEGGNIALNIQDILLLRNGKITATARGAGNSGNLTIDSPILLGIENSDIIANATTGSGGNIDITAKEILGLTFRETLTPDSDITASSESGVSGTVSINGLSFDAGAGLVTLPAEVSDESDRIAKGCGAFDGAQFIASGRGGLSVSPADELAITRPWQDTRSVPVSDRVNADSSVHSNTAISPNPASDAPLLEATGWQQTDSGIMLVARNSSESAAAAPPVAECLT